MPTSPATLRQRLHAATAEALLDSAEAAMLERGYERATMQQIAAAAGCAAGTFYLYFKNKQVLLEAIIERHARGLLAAVEAATGEAREPVARLRGGLAAFLRYGQRHRPFFRLFFTAVPVRHRLVRQRLGGPSRAESDAHDQQALENLRRAQKQGAIRKDLPAETLQAFMEDVAFNLIEQFTFSAAKPSLDEQMRVLWGLIAGGIGARRSVAHA